MRPFDMRSILGIDVDPDKALGLQEGVGGLLDKRDLLKALLKQLTAIRVGTPNDPANLNRIADVKKAFEIYSDPIKTALYYEYKTPPTAANDISRINGLEAPNVIKLHNAAIPSSRFSIKNPLVALGVAIIASSIVAYGVKKYIDIKHNRKANAETPWVKRTVQNAEQPPGTQAGLAH